MLIDLLNYSKEEAIKILYGDDNHKPNNSNIKPVKEKRSTPKKIIDNSNKWKEIYNITDNCRNTQKSLKTTLTKEELKINSLTKKAILL